MKLKSSDVKALIRKAQILVAQNNEGDLAKAKEVIKKAQEVDDMVDCAGLMEQIERMEKEYERRKKEMC